MYRPPSKRKQLVQRALVYAFMTISVVGLVVMLVFVMLGYQYNSDDGKIEQGGLVQFDSQPTGATVLLDGTAFGTRTASKTTMIAGIHTVAMQHSGYDTWKKTINVIPGTVLWLNYARLVPSSLVPQQVADFKTVSSALGSNDDKKMALIDNPEVAAVKVADLTQTDIKIAGVTLPPVSYTVPAEGVSQRFSIEAWGPDNRHLLLKHTYGGERTEWIVVDTQDVAQTKNLSTLLDIDASHVAFSNSNGSQLYVQIGGDIRKVDLNDETLSRPLVTNVSSFGLYSDAMITFVTQPGDNGIRKVGYYIDGADKPRTVRTYKDDGTSRLQFTVGRYFNETYEAIAFGDKIEITKGDLTQDPNAKISLAPVTTLTLPGGAQYLSDKTDGRFIVAQNGATYVTYDVELGKATKTTLKGTGEVSKQLGWIDEYMLWSDRDDTLRLYEFDGANQHDIMKVVPGLDVTLGPKGTYLYGITKSSDGTYHLSRVKLIL